MRWVIGDIHGMLRPTEALIGCILGRDASARFIFVGDYINRGPDSRGVLDRFAREFAPLVTAGPPGVTGYTGGRAKPRPVLAYWPTTVSRKRVQPQVDVRTAEDWARTAGASK